MRNSKIPPLQSIPLTTRPHNHRALAWSSDAELAVAADDSVAIYLPTFPLLDPSQPLAFDEDDDVAADDPTTTTNAHTAMGILPANLAANDDDDDDDLGSDEEEEEEDDDDASEEEGGGAKSVNLQQLLQEQQKAGDRARRQFGDETRRVLWVSYPALHPELNAHVWEAAGKAMPLIRSAEGPPGEDGRMMMDVDAQAEAEAEKGEVRVVSPAGGQEAVPPNGKEQQQPQPQQQPQQPQPPPPPEEEEEEEVNAHPGAGTGTIGGAGASLNHVVAVDWSPAGLGRSLRPVLAVLTGCGSLAVYGEGGPLPFGSAARPSRVLGRGRGAVRDLQSWLVLWAVGENFVVPGQEEYGYGEFVKAFAWSRSVGVGRVLLGYMNDLREVVVLCVGTTFQTTADGLEEAVWNVQEIVRMETGGPHAEVDPLDPDYIPAGSSYCLRWSPWVKDEDSWSCLLSYMDRNYVGFKKITLNAPTWNPREAPILTYESQDWHGVCTHLAADAFLEFEDLIWNINGTLICRGIIATPLVAEPFEVSFNNPSHPAKSTHSTDECNTTFPSHAIHNPITGLIIHPVPLETTAPALTPLYTAVRLSATATNPQWWESNAPLPTPKWVAAINAQITRLVPLGQAIYEGDLTAETAEDGDDGVVPEEEDDADDAASKAAADKSDEGNEDEQGEDADLDADFDAWANEGPDVYPYRMRLWGLALSPGGGSSAVLATPMLTQRPMRGAWSAHRSRVVFGHEDLRRRARLEQEGTGVDESSGFVHVEGLSTEARMWEWMHGGGPDVSGLTPPLAHTHQLRREKSTGGAQRTAQQTRDAALTARRARLWEIFAPFATDQRCEICGGGGSKFVPVKDASHDAEKHPQQDDGDRVLDAECARGGHRVAVCGATGLAIVAPGISRACGVCQSRCLDIGYLVERVLLPAGRREEAEFVAAWMERGVCARCGGKFLD